MRLFSKILCYFLVFYFLLLSWQPCQDFAELGVLTKSLAKTEKIADDKHEEELLDEDCSPFCACSCCRVSAVSYNFSLAEKRDFSVRIKSFLPDVYENRYFPNDLNAVWRPPRS